MKSGVRVLALACAPLRLRNTLLVGIIARDGEIEGIISTKLQVDGTDATDRIIRLFKRTRFGEQVRLIAVNGVGMAGLNILDVDRVERATGARVISVTRRRPHPEALLRALREFSRAEGIDTMERIRMVKRIRELGITRAGGFYLQASMPGGDAAKFVPASVKLLRLAHMVASGVAGGESRGRM